MTKKQKQQVTPLENHLKTHGIKQSFIVVGLNMSKVRVHYLVKGKTVPTHPEAVAIARLLNKGTEELFPVDLSQMQSTTAATN